MSKVNLNQLQFTLSEPPSNRQWTIFVSLQLLDIYTTYRGLQYDCVVEMNPVLGESPSVSKMFFTKAALLAPALNYDLKNENLSQEVFNELNSFMTLVVVNNINTANKAKKYCIKK